MRVHVVARSRFRPLEDPAVAVRLWRRLRAEWPNALAACLMPDHLHVLVQAHEARQAPARLGWILSGLSRWSGSTRQWDPVPRAQPIADGQHFLRHVRYVHLNPCRARLVSDPRQWPWTTHRGLIGAELDPWVGAARLAAAVGRPPTGFRRWFHDYVMGDPSVRDERCGLMPPAAQRRVAAVALEEVCRAAAAATVWSSRATFRKAAVLLAQHQGWTDAEAVAHALGTTKDLVWRHRRERNEELVRVAALCLGDPRLRNLPP